MTRDEHLALLRRALQSPIRLECGPDVERVRQRFYRARQRAQARGNFKFDSLRFHIIDGGGALLIKRYPVRAMSQLRRLRRLLREMCAYAADSGIDVGGRVGRDDRQSDHLHDSGTKVGLRISDGLDLGEPKR